MDREPRALSEAERAALADIKRRVSGLFPVHHYVLFGSKARGDYGPDSDVDLLIVTQRELTRTEKHAISHEVTAANRVHGTLFSFVAIDVQQWESELFARYPLRQRIEREGVSV